MTKNPEHQSLLEKMNDRSRLIFQQIVETYLDTGEPVGSRTLSQLSPLSLSPASIRNVMADLESLGLLLAPHASAGRLPSDIGLRLFVDGLLEVGDLAESERRSIQQQLAGTGRSVEDALTEAISTLSGLSQCAGLVVTPKQEGRLKHIEFVATSPSQALVILVWDDGLVENRVVTLPPGFTPSTLIEAGNYLSAKLGGRTFNDARGVIAKEIETKRAELDNLTAQVVDAGIATWSGEPRDRSLIIRGQANLLEDLQAVDDLERVRHLFEDLERKEGLIHLLDVAETGEGVRIFIGSETQLFSLSGSSVIVSPYMNAEQKVVGVIGVIGPTRLNYARIIPMVDFTAKTVGKLLG